MKEIADSERTHVQLGLPSSADARNVLDNEVKP
jgi:hypothetical protein